MRVVCVFLSCLVVSAPAASLRTDECGSGHPTFSVHTYTCEDLTSGVFLAVKCLEATECQQEYMRNVLHTHTGDGHGQAKELTKS